LKRIREYREFLAAAILEIASDDPSDIALEGTAGVAQSRRRKAVVRD